MLGWGPAPREGDRFVLLLSFCAGVEMAVPGIPGTVFIHPVLILIAADNVEMFSILGSANNVSPTCCLLKLAGEEDDDEDEGEDGTYSFLCSKDFAVCVENILIARMLNCAGCCFKTPAFRKYCCENKDSEEAKSSGFMTWLNPEAVACLRVCLFLLKTSGLCWVCF